jgi:hypothetical protein
VVAIAYREDFREAMYYFCALYAVTALVLSGSPPRPTPSTPANYTGRSFGWGELEEGIGSLCLET